MRFKCVLIALAVFAAYVLGAKAGEERYEEITRALMKHWNDPKVKKARAKARKARAKAAHGARKQFG